MRSSCAQHRHRRGVVDGEVLYVVLDNLTWPPIDSASSQTPCVAPSQPALRHMKRARRMVAHWAGGLAPISRLHRVPERDWSQRKRVSSRCIVQLAQAHKILASNQSLYVTRRFFAWDPRGDDNVVARGCADRVAPQQQASYHCSLSHSLCSHHSVMPTLPNTACEYDCHRSQNVL